VAICSRCVKRLRPPLLSDCPASHGAADANHKNRMHEEYRTRWIPSRRVKSREGTARPVSFHEITRILLLIRAPVCVNQSPQHPDSTFGRMRLRFPSSPPTRAPSAGYKPAIPARPFPRCVFPLPGRWTLTFAPFEPVTPAPSPPSVIEDASPFFHSPIQAMLFQ
jgi:hypothetical protein